jgi:hypothetical protein
MPKILDDVDFRKMKDKGLVVVPKNPNEPKLPEGWPGRDQEKNRAAEPGKR